MPRRRDPAEARRIEESERAYRQAIAVLKAIPAGALDGRREPDGLSSADVVREYLAASYGSLGQLLIDTGRSEEAAQILRRAAELTRAMIDGIADMPANRHLVASSYQRLGILLRQTGRPREAEAAYRKAIELTRAMAGPRDRKIQMGAHANLGTLLSQAGRPAEAEAEYRDALKLYEKLVEGDPGVPMYRHELAMTLMSLGNLLENKADGKPEAEERLRQALKLYDRLAADAPDVPRFRQELAVTLLNLANGLLSVGRWQEAEPLYVRSIELFEALVREPPIDPSIPKPLIMALQKLADLLRATDRPAEAHAPTPDAPRICSSRTRTTIRASAWSGRGTRSGWACSSTRPSAGAPSPRHRGLRGDGRRAARSPRSSTTRWRRPGSTWVRSWPTGAT